MSSKSAGNAEGLTLAKVRQVRDVMRHNAIAPYTKEWRRVAKFVMPRKSPPKLSPQEDRVYKTLLHDRTASVARLYRCARKGVEAYPRVMQQHVGVIISRLNKKRRKYIIVPGGKDAPRTYKLTRRR